MASRRTRLKAVINLPVRRAREEDHSSSSASASASASASTSASSKHVNDGAQSKETTTKLPNVVTEVIDSNKHEEIPKTSVSTSKPPGEEQNDKSEATECTIPEQTQNIPGDSKKDILPPPKLPIPVRKRVKPVVSLSALTRKPKEIALESEKTKEIDAKNLKENTSSVPEKSSEGIVDAQKTSSVRNSVIVNNVRKDDVSGLSPSLVNAQLPSKSHTDNGKLVSPTKVLSKPKFAKLTPRLIDSSTRRHSSQAEVEEKPPCDTSSVADTTASRWPHTPTQQIIPDTDDEFDNSSLYSSTSPQITQLSGKKNTLTAPSVTSTVYEDTLELEDGQPAKVERRPQTHRRPRKSGVGEILSVARRDFYKKFGSNTPDKKQLTMFDLIFYNPTSNPMKHTNKQKVTDQLPSTESKPADVIAERIAEESVDDVAAFEDEVCSAVPAPQVKVGPDGSLIIDEKSLVIATTGSQKRKEELANSSVVVDYGLGNATYNSFSKKVKPKEWSKKETLKFYRALQAVGTDFLLMKSIFPTRTRGDLKQKYKKEDRLNRDLIDKALRNPLEFDLTALEQELEQEGKENQEKEKRRLEEVARNEQLREEESRKQLLRKKGAMAYALLSDLPKNTSYKTKRKGDKSTKKSSKRKRLASDSLSSDDEDDDINLQVHFDNIGETDEKGKSSEEKKTPEDGEEEEHSDDDREELFLLKNPQPTRYGRVPRARSLSRDVPADKDADVSIHDDPLHIDTDRGSATAAGNGAPPVFNMTSLNNVEPGSLVILSTPGQKTLQLFMVAPKSQDSPSQNSSLTHIPVAITPEILASVNNSIDGLPSREENTSRPTVINTTNNTET